jgi:hypothetical protein
MAAGAIGRTLILTPASGFLFPKWLFRDCGLGSNERAS